jgi:hypothetical protein
LSTTVGKQGGVSFQLAMIESTVGKQGGVSFQLAMIESTVGKQDAYPTFKR